MDLRLQGRLHVGCCRNVLGVIRSFIHCHVTSPDVWHFTWLRKAWNETVLSSLDFKHVKFIHHTLLSSQIAWSSKFINMLFHLVVLLAYSSFSLKSTQNNINDFSNTVYIHLHTRNKIDTQYLSNFLTNSVKVWAFKIYPLCAQ